MNARRHPRTLNEAFPFTVSYACSIERPRSLWERIKFIFWSN